MKTDAEIIKELGGPTKVAKLLGYDQGGTQRVWNWTRNGIPARVKLQRPDLFLPDFSDGRPVSSAASSLT